MDILQWQENGASNKQGKYQNCGRTNQNFIRKNVEILRHPNQNQSALNSKSVGHSDITSQSMHNYPENADSFRNAAYKNMPKQTQSNSSNVNYVQANIKAISTGQIQSKKLNRIKPPTTSSSNKQNIGKLPPYLIRRKTEEAARLSAKKAAEERDPTPEGHRRVSEAERISTLHSLEEVYANTIEELNRLPLSTDTYRAQNHRLALESKLADLEEVMNSLRKPVVFMKLD